MSSFKISEIDCRSLTLFRQIIALIFLFKTCILKLVYFDYYSVESGPFANDVISDILNKPILASFINSDFQLIILLCISGLFAITLFLGIFPSLSALASLVFTIVINRRFFPFFDGSDQVLVTILFILFILYIDYKNYNGKIEFDSNPFVLVLLVQVSVIYFFNGVNKTHHSWWLGQAVDITLSNVLINKTSALFISKYSGLTKILTYSTLFFEILFPLLIFIPFKNSLFRIIASFFLIIFHWGISIFVDVSFYKYYGLAFAVLLLPASFWNYISMNIKTTTRVLKVVNFNKVFLKILSIFLCLFIVFKSFSSSIYRQNEVYKVFEHTSFINFIKNNQSRALSPFQQSWIMFAPSPPLAFGFIAFEYNNSVDSTFENINIYGNDILSKKYYHLNPVNSCLFLQFLKVEKGFISEESQFVLFNLFHYEVEKDIQRNPSRKIEDYQLVIYKQTYEEYKIEREYKFDRTILASFD